jgi:predicted GNAT family acetyltransferase
MTHILDRPVWAALAGRHAGFAEGDGLAKRYRPDVIPFAAARDDSPECLAALAALPQPAEVMVLIEANALVPPPGFVPVVEAPGVQMALARAPARITDERIERLTEADAAEMLALAKLTEPGPFTLKAQALGAFFGVRIDGRIAAMAGERMQLTDYAEMSGVCAHPDFRGRGLARRLSIFVTHEILARGQTPFLHAWAGNAPAIRLYESIGYELRATMHVAAIQKA